jgi:DNA primase
VSRIPDEVIEQVRDAADIVGLIGAHVELKRTGADYRGPCPFHGGTHRNFAVIPKRGMYYCFVCHEAGDIFTFLMKKFGMDYPTAVRDVAAKVGITIPERTSGGPDPNEPLYEALTVAAEWYARRLREGKDAAEARAYLEQRGFPPEETLLLGLGFAPKGDEFAAALRQLGFKDERLLDAGLLVKREDGTLRPRFWGRLLFPIHDLRGRVVGFGGRVLGDGEPKYLNSPDSPVFHKGRLLYNLHQAKQAIRQAEFAVLVEGYFDALRLVQVGIENVVAPLGTGLTPDQATLLRRFTGQVVSLYDGDAPGLRATFRAADELLRAGLRVSVATVPPGHDPDTLARKGGGDAVRQVLDDAMDVVERKLQLLEKKSWLQSVAGRRRALDRLLPTLRAAHDPVTRDLYVGRVAEVLGVTRGSIENEMRVTRMQPAARPADGVPPATARAPRVEGAGRDLLRVMVHHPDWRGRIAEQLVDRSALGQPGGRLFGGLAQAGGAPAAELMATLEGDAKALLAELLAEPPVEGEVDPLVEGALNALESRRLRAELDELQRTMAFKPEAEQSELLRRADTLTRQINKLSPAANWNVIRTGRSSAR